MAESEPKLCQSLGGGPDVWMQAEADRGVHSERGTGFDMGERLNAIIHPYYWRAQIEEEDKWQRKISL